MTNHDVQELIAQQGDLDQLQQLSAFVVIMDDFVQRTDPCELYFATFSVEHFINGYVTMDSLEPSFNQVQDFLEKIPVWLEVAREQVDQKEGQVLYFLCRFLSSKGLNNYIRPFCLNFLSQSEREKDMDVITYSYIRHLSQEDNYKPADNPLKTLQANLYIQHTLQESRKALSHDFLDDPYASVFQDYPSIIRPTLARLYYAHNKG